MSGSLQWIPQASGYCVILASSRESREETRSEISEEKFQILRDPMRNHRREAHVKALRPCSSRNDQTLWMV